MCSWPVHVIFSSNLITPMWCQPLKQVLQTSSRPTVCQCLRSFVIWAPFSSILVTKLSNSIFKSSLSSRCWTTSNCPSKSWCSLRGKIKKTKKHYKMSGNKTKRLKRLTHKLICPSSSCRAKSRSESEPRGCSACLSFLPGWEEKSL